MIIDLEYYKNLQYEVKVKKVSCFVAYCDELKVCTGTGETYDEAVQNFYKEKNRIIELLYKNGGGGDSIPLPKHMKE